MGLEVKTEIPANSSGRVVDSLLDIIRPFSESRGLKADQIRLQREDVLIKIAQKARQRMHAEDIEIHPIPNKLMVPFLEKASLEDIETDMQERWASLLVSASKNYESQQLTFIDILSRLSSDELKILEDTCFSFERFPELSYPGGHFETNFNVVSNSAKKLIIDGKHDLASRAQRAFDQFSFDIRNLQYAKLLYATVAHSGGALYFYAHEHNSSIDILKREGLINIEDIALQSNPLVKVGYFDVSRLGVLFVKSCSPKIKIQSSKK